MKKLLLFLVICSNVAFAQRKFTNSAVYAEHPDINTIKKLAVLYEKGDYEGMANYYAPSVKFYGMTRYNPDSARTARHMLPKTKSLSEAKAGWKQVIETWDSIKMVPLYPPIGFEYAGDGFTVQSWWTITLVNKKTGKTAVTDMVLFDVFGKNGKIISQRQCYDPTPMITAMK